MFALLTDLPINPSWLVLLGAGTGILSGLLGVGGGILMTPALHILGLSMPVAVATTLTQMVGASLSGSLQHLRQGNAILPVALLLGLPGVLGMHLGGILVRRLAEYPQSDLILTSVYILLMTYVGLSILLRTLKANDPLAEATKPKWWAFGPSLKLHSRPQAIPLFATTVVGLSVGLLSALTGLGGGFFYVSALVQLTRCTVKEAVGTSLATVFITCLYGSISFGVDGLSQLPIAFVLFIGAVFGAQLGARLAHGSTDRRLQWLFVVLIFSALISMLLKVWDQDLVAHLLLFGTGIAVVLLALLMPLVGKFKKKC